MRVLVTGASGFIGRTVVAELQVAGHTVIGVARSAEAQRALEARGVQVLRASLDDLGTLGSAAHDADGVIHLAFRHGEAPEEALQTDRRAIEALGMALAGTRRPLVITSGTLVLAPDHTGAEADRPDPAAIAAARGANEAVALVLAQHGVRVSVVRLAPLVHDRVKAGFLGALVDIAARTGVSGYRGDGSQRWPALNRRDAAQLFRSALEDAPAGTVLHGVGEEGVPLLHVAEVIGAGLGLPVRSVPDVEAEDHFGWLAAIVAVDAPASSTATRQLLGWQPSHPGLLEDLERGEYFDTFHS